MAPRCVMIAATVVLVLGLMRIPIPVIAAVGSSLQMLGLASLTIIRLGRAVSVAAQGAIPGTS